MSIDMLDRSLPGHETDLRCYGDGYNSPYEDNLYCSCGEDIWEWMQHYWETPDPGVYWEEHLAEVEYGINPVPIYLEIEERHLGTSTALARELTDFSRLRETHRDAFTKPAKPDFLLEPYEPEPAPF